MGPLTYNFLGLYFRKLIMVIFFSASVRYKSLQLLPILHPRTVLPRIWEPPLCNIIITYVPLSMRGQEPDSTGCHLAEADDLIMVSSLPNVPQAFLLAHPSTQFPLPFVSAKLSLIFLP